MFLEFSPPIQVKEGVKTVFKNGIEHIIPTPNDLTTHFVQIAQASDFSLSKVQDFSQTFFCSTPFFLKGYFEAKNLSMEELEICALFFASCLSTFSFLLIINLFLKLFFKLLDGLHRDVSTNTLCHLFCNLISNPSLIVFLNS